MSVSGQDIVEAIRSVLKKIEWPPWQRPKAAEPIAMAAMGGETASTAVNRQRQQPSDQWSANLLRLTWTPITVPGDPYGPPEAVVVPIAGGGVDAAAEARTLTAYALDRIRQWLAEDRSAAARLVFTTRGAIAARPSEPVGDVAAAAVWGLVRAAQSEYPGRFVLIDYDGEIDNDRQGPSPATLLVTGEPELLVRGDTVLAGRLARFNATMTRPGPATWDPDGTVLITGFAGGLAGELARHLVAEHHIRHLVLVSQQSGDTPSVVVLQAELIAHGVQVTFAACDLTDRASLAGIIAAVPAEHPLTAVVHTAGALGSGAAALLSPDVQSATLAPKADGAWHLHELTLGVELAAFVTFSSISGVLGNRSHAGNSAANAFLDALAQHRAEAGLPATSIAWSNWNRPGRPGRPIGRRRGAAPLSVMDGPALFDAAVSTGVANVVAVGGLAGLPRTAAEVPAMLRELVRGTRRPLSAAERGALEAPASRRLEWVPAPAVSATAITWTMLGGGPAGSPAGLIMAEVAGSPGADVGDAVQEITMRVVGLTHQWLADSRYEGRPLVVHTHHAVAATRDDHIEDLAGAAAWGVVRAVQAEHPGRFVLLDGEVDDRILGALPGLIATGNAQFAVRDGTLLVGH